jgi:hypothetical protein
MLRAASWSVYFNVSWPGHVLGLVPRITRSPTSYSVGASEVVGDRAKPGHDTIEASVDAVLADLMNPLIRRVSNA